MDVGAERYRLTLASMLVVLGLALVPLWLAVARLNTNWTLFGLAVYLTALGALCFWLSSRAERVAGGLLLVGLTLAALAVLRLTGLALWSVTLVIPTLMAGHLFRPWTSLAFAGPSAILAFVSTADPRSALPLVAVLLASGAITYAGTSRSRDLLCLHSQRSLRAYDLLTQVRQRQGELNQTVKALDVAYRLLEESNYRASVARREAEEWRDLKTRFATNLSHELRTPLNVILGFTKLIYRGPHLYGFDGWPESLMKDLVQVQRNAAFLSDLVNDIVDMARVDALAMPIRREDTDLDQLIQDVAGTVASLAQEKGVRLRVEVPPDLPSLNVDPIRVRQVLFNLVTNAIRFTDEGQITISAGLEGEEIVTSVQDTGRGIPAGQLDRIFDEFLQVGGPKEDENPGKGLGLAIARRFVQLHGGRIWVQSAEGRGSVFSFSLPLAARATSRLRSGSYPLPPRLAARPLVLVVDEDVTATAYLERQMDDHRFLQVRPDEAADLPPNLAPVAAIVNLPPDRSAEGGSSLLSRPAGLAEDTPVIYCALPSLQWISGHERFDAILTKPVSSEELLETVRPFLRADQANVLLVVDDDRGFVQLVSRTFEAEGIAGLQVAPAYNGADALRKAGRYRPAAILMDLVMPGMNGFTVLDHLREDEALRDTPVVAVTAASPGEDDVAARGTRFTVTTRGRGSQRLVLALISTVLGDVRARAPLVEGNGEGQR